MKDGIEREIENLLVQFDPQTASRVRPILYANLIACRIATYLSNPGHSLEQYVHTVTANYNASSPYLFQLQVVRSEAHWRPLLHKLYQWVFAYFLRKGLPTAEAEEFVRETAENAALEIVISQFPYDVPFDVWAMVITQKQCRRSLSNHRKDETGS